METLNNIEQKLINIFQEIEDNDGEITENQLKELEITENNLKEKLSNYRKIINEWESNIDYCKKESKRLNDIAKVRQNRITKLKNNMLYAVNLFGNTNKNSKFIELEDCRIFTRNSKSVEIDNIRCLLFKQLLFEKLKELYDNNIDFTGNNFDIQGIIDSINNEVKAKHGEDVDRFTIDDLKTLSLNININSSIIDLITYHNDLLKFIIDNEDNKLLLNLSFNNSKTELGKMINDGFINITYANIKTNQSLQIK